MIKKIDVYDDDGEFLFTMPDSWVKPTFWERVANWVASFIVWARR